MIKAPAEVEHSLATTAAPEQAAAARETSNRKHQQNKGVTGSASHRCHP
jgi:hypothetical protein